MSSATDTLVTPGLAPESTVGALVVAHPALARLFEKLDIDYCCGGKQTLAAACARKGLDVDTILAAVDAVAVASAGQAPEVDAAAMSLAELADHIEATHHAYLKVELPRLVEMADRVALKHAWRDPRLPELAQTVQILSAEMLGHMQKEEGILFPMVRQIESGARPDMPGSVLAGPIGQMEAEHDAAGHLTVRARELTDGFTPDGDSCNTHRALLAGLAEFESDLHRHVSKENNILFPRALALAAKG